MVFVALGNGSFCKIFEIDRSVFRYLGSLCPGSGILFFKARRRSTKSKASEEVEFFSEPGSFLPGSRILEAGSFLPSSF